MFALTALVFPGVLAVLCLGAGLLVERGSGGPLPGALLPALGAGALIAVSQLTSYVPNLAPATPYVMAAVALGGFVLARRRVATLIRRAPSCGWQIAVPVLAYVLALAPVLFAGRPTFSSYMALTDSAVHMIGADFLISHGQDYAHLDLRNSYGQFINDYYNTSYPSGADTLFGGSALLMRLPLIWAYQPFNAFVLATATGPAWLLVRRIGLEGGWAALAALSATVPALVYGYELVGSVKEVTALPLILTLGVLVVGHRGWLGGPPARVLPFAVAAAGGVSALGAGFGAWVLAAAAILAGIMLVEISAGRERARRYLLLVGAGVAATLVCALPTWVDLSGSLRVAQNIASTGNQGNLRAPLHAEQAFGTWLWSSYKLVPTGRALVLTYLLIIVGALAAVLGVAHVLRRRDYALAGWLAVTLAVWLGLSTFGTAWVGAKALMLSSPVVVLVAWGGVAALLRASASRQMLRGAAPLLALALAGGVLASDAMQYHSSNLAPTSRYDEMASLNSRFSGRGPALFTDFDEYAMYELRGLDVGGPNFIYPPVALAHLTKGHGGRESLDAVPPAKLRGYPLILTRRNPTASRPPSAYSLIWQGTYYQVWRRQAGAPAAIAHSELAGGPRARCRRIQHTAQIARSRGAQLVAAAAPELVWISVPRARHPAAWAHTLVGVVMKGPGRLRTTFETPHGGPWDIWVEGQIMRPVHLSVDGYPVGSIGGQLGGNSLNPDIMSPLRVSLAAGRHLLSLTHGGATLAPGDGGWAILARIFLTPSGAGAGQSLRTVPAASWRSLCGQRLAWIEAVRA